MDVRSFLAAIPPFEDLDAAVLDRVVANTEIAFFPEGALVLEPTGEPARFAYVVRTGAIELLVDGHIVDVLGPGEMFGHPSLLSGEAPSFVVRALEDTLCYLIEGEVAREVLASQAGLSFLSSSLRRRVTRALEETALARGDPWRTRVATLIRRPVVTCSAQATVQEAAVTMARERISSLLVPTSTGWGILTDRDLRTRVVAEGRASGVPVSEVMTPDALVIDAETLAPDAMRSMLERGVHHLPVVHAGELVGVVTDSDLIGLERRTPFVLRSEIERAPDRSSAVAAFGQLRNVVADLVEARVDPIDIGHVVGVTIDALTERCLELAESELGPAPCAWAWMALGSQARHEQALATDQDHALAYDPQEAPVEEVDRYFAGLAELVESDLERAGIPRCRARVSATQRSWRGTPDQWAGRFRGWMSEIDEGGAVLTAIGFDFRRVAGVLPVDERLQEVVAEAPSHPVFLRNLARQALALEPPTGFIRDIVVEARGEHAGTFDVKHGGILAITGLARVAALAAGSTERRTLPRLRAAAAHGRLVSGDEEALDESFRLLWDIRLEHQCARMSAGLAPDDHVDPKDLGMLTRQALKEAFRAIERAQRALAVEFGLPAA